MRSKCRISPMFSGRECGKYECGSLPTTRQLFALNVQVPNRPSRASFSGMVVQPDYDRRTMSSIRDVSNHTQAAVLSRYTGVRPNGSPKGSCLMEVLNLEVRILAFRDCRHTHHRWRMGRDPHRLGNISLPIHDFDVAGCSRIGRWRRLFRFHPASSQRAAQQLARARLLRVETQLAIAHAYKPVVGIANNQVIDYVDVEQSARGDNVPSNTHIVE